MRNNLILLRETVGMTQKQFGELTGYTPQKVSNLEHARIKGSPETWITIQKIFNLTPDETLNLMEVIQKQD